MPQPPAYPDRYVLDAVPTPATKRPAPRPTPPTARKSLAPTHTAKAYPPRPAGGTAAPSPPTSPPPASAWLAVASLGLCSVALTCGFAWQAEARRADLSEANHRHLLRAADDLLAQHRLRTQELRATEQSREELLSMLDKAAQDHAAVAVEMRIWQRRQVATEAALVDQSHRWNQYGEGLHQRLSLTANELANREHDLTQTRTAAERAAHEHSMKLGHLSSANDALSRENNDLGQSVSSLRNENSSLESNLSSLRSENSCLSTKLSSAENAQRSAESEASSLRSEVNCLRSRVSSLESQLSSARK